MIDHFALIEQSAVWERFEHIRHEIERISIENLHDGWAGALSTGFLSEAKMGKQQNCSVAD